MARIALRIVVIASLFPALLPAQPVPAGPWFQVNTSVSGGLNMPSVGIDATGNATIVWESEHLGEWWDVFGQRFDAADTPQAGEFQVNTFTLRFQGFYPEMAMDAAGSFVVVWSSSRQDDGAASGIFAQRFNPDGSPVGSEFQVNTYTPSFQVYPEVAMNSAGEFVVVWASYLQAGNQDYEVVGQRFDPDGEQVGGEFQVNTYVTGHQENPEVTIAGDGSFLVVWESWVAGEGRRVVGRRFDAAADPLGGELEVTGLGNDEPALGGNDAGDAVVVWRAPDADGTGIFGQRYDANGIPQGSSFPVNTTTTDDQKAPSVAVGAAGNFVVAWQGRPLDRAFIQVFDATGAPHGGESTVEPQVQRNPDVAMNASGTFVVTWWSGAIFAKRYLCEPLPEAASGLALAPLAGGTQLGFTWTDAPGAADHVVLESEAPEGPFFLSAATALNGATGATIPMPPGTRYYRVSGRNPQCGLGP
jgi:hypothetical protein